MTVPIPGGIQCPGCGKQYHWAQEFAGQRVRCNACMAPLVMPFDPPQESTTTTAIAAPIEDTTYDVDMEPVPLLPIEDDEPAAQEPPTPVASSDSHTLLQSLNEQSSAPLEAPADDNTYDLDLPEEAPVTAEQLVTAPDGKCPNCGNSVSDTAVVCTNCGFDLKEGKKLDTAVGETTEQDAPAATSNAAPTSMYSAYMATARVPGAVEEDHTFTEIWAPAILGIVGLVLILLDCFLILDPQYMFDSTLSVTPRILRLIQRFFAVGFQLPFLFGGIVVVGMLFGTSFSSVWSAILKFVSVALFLNGFEGCLESLMDRITEGLGFAGMFVTATLNMGAFFGICAWIFDLDITETFLLWAVSMMLPMWLGMFLFAMWFSAM